MIDAITYRVRIGCFLPRSHSTEDMASRGRQPRFFCPKVRESSPTAHWMESLLYAVKQCIGSLTFIMMLLVIAGIELNPGPNSDAVKYSDMHLVSTKIGNEWQNLAYALFAFQDTTITKPQVIQHLENSQDSLYKRCFEMFNMWKEQCPESATRENLIAALREIGKCDLAVELESAAGTKDKTQVKRVSFNTPSANSPSCPSESRQISDESPEEILHWLQTELKQHYEREASNLLPIHGMDHPLHIGDVYTNLEVVKQENKKKQEKEEKQSTRGSNRIKLEDILPIAEPSKPQTVLVEGAPGSGKSTLCRKIVYDWAVPPTKQYWVHTFKLVFLIEVRHLSDNIEDAMIEQNLPLDMPENRKKHLLEYIKTHQKDCLFVIDGYDEKSISSNLEMLVNKRIYSQSNIILTSRPTRIKDKSTGECVIFDRHLVNRGYVLSDAIKFVTKYFKSLGKNEEYCNGLVRKMYGNTVIADLIQSPLNVVFLCFIWEGRHDKTTLPQTITELYHELTKAVVKRYCSKQGENVLDASWELPGWCEEILTSIQRIALQGLNMDLLVFNETDRVLQSIDKKAFQIGFLNKELSTSRMYRCDRYMFPHKTLQEFLAAQYIINQTAEWQNHFITENAEDEVAMIKYSAVFVFITGLVGVIHETEITDQSILAQLFDRFVFRMNLLGTDLLTDEIIPNIVMQCLKESKYSKDLAARLVPGLPKCIYVRGKGILDEIFQHEIDLVMGFYILYYCDEKIVCLNSILRQIENEQLVQYKLKLDLRDFRCATEDTLILVPRKLLQGINIIPIVELSDTSWSENPILFTNITLRNQYDPNIEIGMHDLLDLFYERRSWIKCRTISIVQDTHENNKSVYFTYIPESKANSSHSFSLKVSPLCWIAIAHKINQLYSFTRSELAENALHLYVSNTPADDCAFTKDTIKELEVDDDSLQSRYEDQSYMSITKKHSNWSLRVAQILWRSLRQYFDVHNVTHIAVRGYDWSWIAASHEQHLCARNWIIESVTITPNMGKIKMEMCQTNTIKIQIGAWDILTDINIESKKFELSSISEGEQTLCLSASMKLVKETSVPTPFTQMQIVKLKIGWYSLCGLHMEVSDDNMISTEIKNTHWRSVSKFIPCGTVQTLSTEFLDEVDMKELLPKLGSNSLQRFSLRTNRVSTLSLITEHPHVSRCLQEPKFFL